MQVIIEGSAKEIAALALELQRRQSEESRSQISESEIERLLGIGPDSAEIKLCADHILKGE